MMGLWDRLRGDGKQNEAAPRPAAKGATVRQIEADLSPDINPAITGIAPGELLGGVYPVVRLLGRGGFGEVYLCTQPAWNIDVAVKMPNKESLAQRDILRWLQREAEAWTNLGLHPHIAYCYHLHPIGDMPLLVVEYVPGGTLLDYLRRKDNPAANNPRASVDLALQMCHALEHAHGRGVIHRDLKPENMLLTADGLVKLTDFGIAQIGAAAPEGVIRQPLAGGRRSFWGGTEGYAAPEQFDRSKEIDARADLFGLGVCLYELFSGRRPYSTTFGPRQEAPDPAQLRRDGRLPVGLAPLLRRMVSWNAADRPASAEAVRDELANIYRRAYGEIGIHSELPPLEMTASGHNNRGVSYYFLGKIKAAESAFAQALEADPLHPEATYNHGALHWRQGELTDTDLLYRLAHIRSSTEDWRATYLMGLVHLERHDREAAATLLAEAEQAAPQRKEVMSALAQARKMPDRAAAGLIRTFEERFGKVDSVSLSVDGRLALSCHKRTIRLWDVTIGKCLSFFEGHTEWVQSVAFSASGQMALSASGDNTLRLWELSSGKCLRIFEGHTAYVGSVAFSPDGRKTLSGSYDKSLRLWDLATAKCLRSFDGHSDGVLSVSISPDGRLAMSGSMDSTFKLWDMETGQCVRTSRGHTDGLFSVAFSPDGRLTLSGSGDTTLRLWALDSGECLQVLKGHTDTVKSVAFSSDGRLALSGSYDNTIRLWDVTSGKCLRTFEGHTRSVYSIAVSAESRQMLSGSHDGTLRLWEVGDEWEDHGHLELAKPEPLADLLGTTHRRKSLITKINEASTAGQLDVALQAIAMLEALPGQQRNTEVVEIRQRLTVRCRRGEVRTAWLVRKILGNPGPVHSVMLSSDGRKALSRVYGDKSFRLWDVETGKCLRIFEGHKDDVTGLASLAYSPDGSQALSGSRSGVIRLWSLATGECLRAFEGHAKANWVTSVTFSPDGRMALSGSDEKTLRLWDLTSGKCLRIFEGHTDAVTSAVISPDGRTALSGSANSMILLWDLASGSCLRIFEGHTGATTGRVDSVVFSPNGRKALSSWWDNTIRLWDVQTGKCCQVFRGHTEPVRAAVFSSDGLHAVSGSVDGSCRLWDVESGNCLHVLPGEGHSVSSIALSSDAITLLAGDGPCINVWHLDWELLPPIVGAPKL